MSPFLYPQMERRPTTKHNWFFFSNFLKAVYDLIQKHVTPFFISSRDIVTRLFLGVKIVHVHVHVSHS